MSASMGMTVPKHGSPNPLSAVEKYPIFAGRRRACLRRGPGGLGQQVVAVTA